MSKEKLLKLSLYLFIASLIVFVINYFFYHFVTDTGISLTWNEEPGKPFVANMIAMLGVLLLSYSILCLIITFVFYSKKDK